MYDKKLVCNYKSKSQIARVLTENWFLRQMYCPNCLASPVNKEKDNSKVVDFSCFYCRRFFQLKGQNKKFGLKMNDGAYSPMIERIEAGKSPDFFFMEYTPEEYVVKNLLLVPSFFVTSSVIEKRTPLSKHAVRAGWTGCNILLSKLPEEGKITVIKNEREIEKEEVKRVYHKLIFLEAEKPTQRSWITDVLRCVQNLDKENFVLDEVYCFENELKQLYPNNLHIKDKIRQQLQILRDKGILEFEGQGKYKLRR
ncbi:MAG: DpnI domain-containing protein [Candidatus Micrarchaeota archaeon]